MKSNMQIWVFGVLMDGFSRKASVGKSERKAVKQEYREIIARAKDIGSSNILLSSYAMAAYFIALNRRSGLKTPEENFQILDRGFRESRAVPMFLGNAESYLSEKRMPGRLKWSEDTHKKKYENDWVVDIIPKSEDYVFGYDYLECGVCKLCRDEGCFELAKYLCRMDYMLTERIGVKLTRTMTLADGCEKCDFRFNPMKK